ncbi:MAG TPA: UvrD-helicase domain-containing protein, partial [Solirubrobacteraceae bacterium]
EAPQLTAEQREAVSRRGEQLSLSAAAGSGKTSVLVERFVAAVREDGVAPGRILAITFTERAAGELRARVRARLLELGEREAARDTEAAFVGTFHGFCARLLRTHPLDARVDPAFTILDEGLARGLREQAFANALEGFMAEGRAEALDLLAAYRVEGAARIVMAVYAELRSRGQLRPSLPDAAASLNTSEGADARAEADAVRACALFDELLGRFGDAYEELKEQRGSLDFDDLELRAGALLEAREPIRRAWSERFELLMVDEFQDTNPRQLAILSALERGNLFTVGDEFQSIYGFRHADVGLFRERRAELARLGASLALTQNFRSRASLLGVVNAAFAERFEDYMPLLAGRAVDAAASGPEVELLLTDTKGWEEPDARGEELGRGLSGSRPWRQAEARLLARRVSELIDAGKAQAGEIVVLLRATGDLDMFERALQLQGLRTVAVVGAFWEDQQIVDLTMYLRALANPLDDLAVYSLLASPMAGCSLDGLGLLARAAHESGSLWEAIESLRAGLGEEANELGEEDLAAVSRAAALLRAERAGAGRRTTGELIERALAATGYADYVLGLEWGERRLANIHKLLRVARRFEAVEGRDLRGFLDHVQSLQEGAAVEPDAPVEGVEPDAVRLMTTHAAKGLEFPVVFVADLGRLPNQSTPDLLVEGERVGLRLLRLDTHESAHTLAYDELCQQRRGREAAEEDRILYVAMTRARDRLVLSGSVALSKWPANRRTPISWLAPALAPQLLELLEAGAEPGQLLVGAAQVPVAFRLNRVEGVAELLAGLPDGRPPAGGDFGPARPLAPGAQAALGIGAAPPRAAAAPLERAPAAPAATIPGGLSYTSLSEYERCGYRFYLERVLGLAEDRAAARGESGGGLDARERGTLVHRLMELLDFKVVRLPRPAEILEVAAGLGLSPQPEEAEELAALLAEAARTDTARRLAEADVVGREHPFAFTIGEREPLLGGVIDLLAVDRDGGSLVVDYKSDRMTPLQDLAVHVEQEYAVQRQLYALAVLRGGAPWVEVLHWFLARPEEPVGVRFEASARPALERALMALTARVLAGDFAVSPAPHRALCLTCPGRRTLCSWEQTETLRDHPPGTEGPGETVADGPLTLF